jgi:ribosome-binding ATPase YchF (GTP1/OBG family)
MESFEDRQLFLEDLGLSQSGVARLITSTYRLLNLATYFTAGVQEYVPGHYQRNDSSASCRRYTYRL